MMKIEALTHLFIGRKLDSGVERVEIDCTSWREKYPNLTDYRIEVTAPNGVVYMPVVTMQDNVLVWEIKRSDTAVNGQGKYQIVATGADGERKTSHAASLGVMSIMPGTAQKTPPAPSQPWTDEVVNAAKRAEEAAKIAEAGGASPEQIKGAVQDYLKENPPQGVSDEHIKDVTAEMLKEAQESGVFDGKDGADGYTPVKGVDYFDGKDGADGVDGKDGADGKDYILTDADKREIAGMVEVGGGGTGGGVTDDHINSLIDAKLGVIENGTY